MPKRDLGFDIVSGLHTRLGAIPGLAEIAAAHGARLIDVRVPPTDLTVANTGIVPTTFVLKFLGNSADGRSGPEKSYPIGANSFTTFPDVLGTVFGLTKDFGAILITSPSDALRAIEQLEHALSKPAAPQPYTASPKATLGLRPGL